MKNNFNAYFLNDGRVLKKVTWDKLWHVIYQIKEFGKTRVTWDRITARQAKKLRKNNAQPCYSGFEYV